MTAPGRSDGVVVQSSAAAQIAIDVAAGCRLASLQVLGHELLVTHAPDPVEWGSYPMAPWAGRTRDARFRFDGSVHPLDANRSPHAIHGTVFDRSWRVVASPTRFESDLGPGWPFAGFVRQEIRLGDDRLDLRLEVHAAETPMPAACGWHPWFRRQVGDAEADLAFTAGFMEIRDAAGIPTGDRVSPPPGPWDDCFGDLVGPSTITWPGVLRLTMSSSCEYLVVYDERPHAICVEPQTAPPDALNRIAATVEPGRPLVATTSWRWEAL